MAASRTVEQCCEDMIDYNAQASSGDIEGSSERKDFGLEATVGSDGREARGHLK